LLSGAESEADPWITGEPAVEMPRNPNHLEPIPAYDPDGYNQAVFKSLIGEDAGELWMISKPSFSTEYAVILRHVVIYVNPDDVVDRKVETEKWMVEYVEPKKQIWRWKEIEGGKSVLDIHVTKEVTRRQVEVSKEFSSTMSDAWTSVLRKTRYADTGYQGFDGATFQFYCHYHLFGEIWSPNSGLPAMLTELGEKLAEVAKAEVQDRSKLIAECTALAMKIKAEDQKPPQKDGDSLRSVPSGNNFPRYENRSHFRSAVRSAGRTFWGTGKVLQGFASRHFHAKRAISHVCASRSGGT